jgi:hypothetical protein
LIARFIDKTPEFVFVPSEEVLTVAAKTGATPYDIPGVELSHVGERCSFDAFLEKYALKTPALERLAVIVRAADTSRLDLAPEAPGLFAISVGLSHNFTDDQQMLQHDLRRVICLVYVLSERAAGLAARRLDGTAAAQRN